MERHHYMEFNEELGRWERLTEPSLITEIIQTLPKLILPVSILLSIVAAAAI